MTERNIRRHAALTLAPVLLFWTLAAPVSAQKPDTGKHKAAGPREFIWRDLDAL